MTRSLRVAKRRPHGWPDDIPAGIYETPFGVKTITDKGQSTTELVDPVPMRMPAKAKHRRGM